MDIDLLMAKANIAAQDELPKVLKAIRDYRFLDSDNEPCGPPSADELLHAAFEAGKNHAGE